MPVGSKIRLLGKERQGDAILFRCFCDQPGPNKEGHCPVVIPEADLKGLDADGVYALLLDRLSTQYAMDETVDKVAEAVVVALDKQLAITLTAPAVVAEPAPKVGILGAIGRIFGGGGG